jgi:hypothetical protein
MYCNVEPVPALHWPSYEGMNDKGRRGRMSAFNFAKVTLAEFFCNAIVERIEAAQHAVEAGRRQHSKSVTVPIGIRDLVDDDATAAELRGLVHSAARSPVTARRRLFIVIVLMCTVCALQNVVVTHTMWMYGALVQACAESAGGVLPLPVPGEVGADGVAESIQLCLSPSSLEVIKQEARSGGPLRTYFLEPSFMFFAMLSRVVCGATSHHHLHQRFYSALLHWVRAQFKQREVLMQRISKPAAGVSSTARVTPAGSGMPELTVPLQHVLDNELTRCDRLLCRVAKTDSGRLQLCDGRRRTRA